ncbi:hypothetical protein [Tenacibaculum sp. IB213877]|uniref:hypothetical protein n=1 Tax=Tenacibaculum sp. IB213877 TaxID=3097351 RepID=UPI002A5B01A5|nr:hypothetical protein [Tenacibaculum sp. IB213877]MDY0779772.1 hypothetical protein [Tenacibaculum sp. IB213877]
MGENKHIEELDAFAKKYVKEITEEKPSGNFTSSIMNAILAEESKKVYQTNYRFSYSIWMVLGGFIIASIYLLVKGKSTAITLPEVDFGSIQFLDFEMRHLLDAVTFSLTTVYAFFFLTLLFGVQAYFLKNYYEKRFQ